MRLAAPGGDAAMSDCPARAHGSTSEEMLSAGYLIPAAQLSTTVISDFSASGF
jgi:hypothetical protein